jgi:predicted nucleic acid-binding protein
LLQLTKLSIDDLAEIETLLTGNITFINEELLPKELLLTTENLLKNIDIADTPFVALARHLEAKLWTGDMKLYNGPKAKRFKNIISTAELSLLTDQLESD